MTGKHLKGVCDVQNVLGVQLFCTPESNKCVNEKEIIKLASEGQVEYTSLIKWEIEPGENGRETYTSLEEFERDHGKENPQKRISSDEMNTKKEKQDDGLKLLKTMVGFNKTFGKSCDKGGVHESAGGHWKCIKYYPLDHTCDIKEVHVCAKCGQAYSTMRYRSRIPNPTK